MDGKGKRKGWVAFLALPAQCLTSLSARSICSASRGHVPTIDLALDALEKPRQDWAGAYLVEAVAALGEQVAHRLLPQHRLQYLTDQQTADLLRITVRAGIDI